MFIKFSQKTLPLILTDFSPQSNAQINSLIWEWLEALPKIFINDKCYGMLFTRQTENSFTNSVNKAKQKLNYEQ